MSLALNNWAQVCFSGLLQVPQVPSEKESALKEKKMPLRGWGGGGGGGGGGKLFLFRVDLFPERSKTILNSSPLKKHQFLTNHKRNSVGSL